jgi:hypothetical protein
MFVSSEALLFLTTLSKKQNLGVLCSAIVRVSGILRLSLETDFNDLESEGF